MSPEAYRRARKEGEVKPFQKSKRMCYVGIDPAFRKNGFAIAIIDEVKELSHLTIKDFTHFLKWLNEAPKNAVVLVENSNMQNTSFDKQGSKTVISRKGRNVGANQAVSQITFELCRGRWPNTTHEVSPLRKGHKWTQETYELVMKQSDLIIPKKRRVSQDARDATKLAYMAYTNIMYKKPKR